MIEWVYHAAKKCGDLAHVVVATDDERIAEAVKNFGGEYVMTRTDHVSGFDRIVEVAAKFGGYTHYVNVQGDEPLLPAANISGALALFKQPAIGAVKGPALRPIFGSPLRSAVEGCHIATTAVAFATAMDFHSENQVKVVLAADSRALYFSRAPIPFYRKGDFAGTPQALKHQGLYAYSRDALLALAALPVSPLEEAESLEQLRFLYHGFNIYVHIASEDSPGVDIPEDIAKVERVLAR